MPAIRHERLSDGICVTTKLHHILTEAHGDNFCMRLYTFIGKICPYTKAHSAWRFFSVTAELYLQLAQDKTWLSAVESNKRMLHTHLYSPKSVAHDTKIERKLTYKLEIVHISQTTITSAVKRGSRDCMTWLVASARSRSSPAWHRHNCPKKNVDPSPAAV